MPASSLPLARPEDIELEVADIGDIEPIGALSQIAARRRAGSMGLEQIGQTSGPGVLGALQQSYLGHAAQGVGENLSRAASGAGRFLRAPGPALAETILHPTADSPVTDVLGGAVNAGMAGFAPLGAAPYELTRGASELMGADPEAAQHYGSRAAMASEFIAGGLPGLEHMVPKPVEEYLRRGAQPQRARPVPQEARTAPAPLDENIAVWEVELPEYLRRDAQPQRPRQVEEVTPAGPMVEVAKPEPSPLADLPLRPEEVAPVRMPPPDPFEAIRAEEAQEAPKPPIVEGSQRPVTSPKATGPAITPAELAALPEALPEDISYVRVYHGSPHEFDKFDISKVGTGEGAQAYGHGLYFAENKGVAEQYAKMGERNPTKTALAEYYSPGRVLQKQGYTDKIIDYDPVGGRVTAERTEGGQTRTVKYGDLGADPQHIKATLGRDLGELYEADIPHSAVSRMLDWDKPLSEQPENVRTALGSIFDAAEKRHMEQWKRPDWARNAGDDPNIRYENAINVGTIYNGLAPKHGGAQALSVKLRELGIPGIRYLDQGSRDAIGPPREIGMNDGSIGWEVESPTGARKFTDKPSADAFYKTVKSDKVPTHNFVLFDDSLVKMAPKAEKPSPTLPQEARTEPAPIPDIPPVEDIAALERAAIQEESALPPQAKALLRIKAKIKKGQSRRMQLGAEGHPPEIIKEILSAERRAAAGIERVDPRGKDPQKVAWGRRQAEMAGLDMREASARNPDEAGFIEFRKPPGAEAEALPVEAPTVAQGAEQVKPSQQLELIPGGRGPAEPPGELPKYAGSVNLERIRSTEDVKQAIVKASKAIEQSAPVSNNDLVIAAHDLGFGIEDAEKFARMTQKQRAGFLATRNVHTGLQEKFIEARDAFKDDPTRKNFDGLKLAQANALRGFAAAQEAAREAGRALQSFKIESYSDISGIRAKRVIDDLLLRIETKGKLSDEITRRLAYIDLTDTVQVNKFLRALYPEAATFRDKLFEAYLASILSGPSTHIANTVGNATMMPIRATEGGIAGGIDAALGIFTGKRTRFAGEAAADVAGMAGGVTDGARAFLKTMKDGYTESGKIETRGPAIAGTKGKVIRAPLTLLSATDDLYQTIGKRGALYKLAYRKAAESGLTGNSLKAKFREIIENPSPELLEAAREEARLRVFQSKTGVLGEMAKTARRKLPGSEYIIPFIDTPINIAKAGLERTPLNAIKILKMAKEGRLGQGELADELAKMAIGSVVSAAIALKVAAGEVSGGGPVDPDQRKALMATGWQPYSFKASEDLLDYSKSANPKNRWYSYARVEPIATMVGVAADFTEFMRQASEPEQKQVASKIAAAMARNLTNKTFLRGLSDFFEAMHDPEKKLSKMAGGLAGAVVPSAVASFARAQDTQMREVRGIVDSIKARIPVQRETLYPKRDVRGQPIPAPGEPNGFWSRMLSPVQQSVDRGGPLEKLMVDVGQEIGPVSRTISKSDKAGNPHKIKLSDADYDRLQQVVGGKTDQIFKKIEARMPRFQTLPPETQRRILSKAVTEARSEGRNAFLKEMRDSGRLQELKSETLERERKRKEFGNPYAVFAGE